MELTLDEIFNEDQSSEDKEDIELLLDFVSALVYLTKRHETLIFLAGGTDESNDDI